MDYAKLSKSGDREINEDFTEIVLMKDKTIFILADGLGGHGCGEIASKEAVNTVKKHFINNPDEEINKLMTDSFQIAHDMMKKLQKEVHDDSFFKTTLVILAVGEDDIIWGHIGDSRLYHFENNKLIERSMDHSVPQMLVNTGKLKESKMRHHEDRNRLTRVLGAEEETSKPFITFKEPVNKGAAFLLCSDGFWEFINEKNMEKLLKKSESSEEWLYMMEKKVLKNGAKFNMDNYSAITVNL